MFVPRHLPAPVFAFANGAFPRMFPLTILDPALALAPLEALPASSTMIIAVPRDGGPRQQSEASGSHN